MSATVRLEIVSPEGSVCSLAADSITLPTASGEITVLPGHVPLFTRLVEGEITILAAGETTYVGITDGFLDLAGDVAVVLADYAVRSDTIISARAAEAKKAAEDAMRRRTDKAGFHLAEHELRRSVMELKIADRLQRRPRRKQ